MISEAHKSRLLLHYAIDPERPEVRAMEESGQLRSVTSEEISSLSGWKVEGSGLFIGYPGNGAFVIRPDSPPANGPKYLHPKGEPNSVYIPPGLDLARAQEIWLTEGELKALCGSLQGLPVVALGGVWSWRTKTEEASLLAEGEKLKDAKALLPELAQVSWAGKKISLLYDSDITPGHKAYDAFPRLAEQLYRLGAEEVRILTLPPVAQGQKTGLDDFILARGPEQALQDLQAMRDRAEPYLPWRDGGLTYAERLIKSQDMGDKQKATIAYLGAKGEVFTLDWLKQTGLQSDIRKALLSEAKKALKELQAKPRASSQAGGDLPELGPEYAQVSALLAKISNSKEGYGVTLTGIFYKLTTRYDEASGKEKPKFTDLSNFVAWPIREILKDSGNGTPEKFVELQGLLQGGVALNPEKILLSDFAEKNSWAVQLWGVKVAIRPYEEKEVRYAVQLMGRDIPKTTIYTHLGWRKIGDSWIYLHAEGALGSEAVEIEISERLRQYALPKETGDIKEALTASLSLLELGPKKIMYPLISLIYLAPLCEPLRQAGIEPGLLSYIWGPSGSQKSTLIALLLSHCGNFAPKGLPASFRDTAYSIEKLAFLAKDTVLAVDDLYPAREPKERAKPEGVLEYLSRNQGDRTGKGRMRADTSLREGLPPRGLALCSGEIMPLVGSSLARNLVFRLQKGDLDSKKLTLAQAQKALLSQAMRAYIEWLAPQMEALPGQLKEAFIHSRDEASKKAAIKTRHGRLNEAISHLLLGLNSFLSFAVSQEAISKAEGEQILQEAWETFNQIADEQALQEQAGEPSRKIAEASMELEAQGRIHWADMEDASVLGFFPGSVKVGWKNEEAGIYYTNLGALLREVNQHLRGQDEFLPITKADFIIYLNQKGFLIEKDRGKNQKTIWVKDNSEDKKARKTFAISKMFFEGEEREDEE